MRFDRDIEAFINEFVKDLLERNVAVFAGAGLSKGQGYVDWPELLRDIAQELGLEVEKETDLISLAQYHVNHRGSSAGITKKILEEFSAVAESSDNHAILARLPITTFWTTNYDTLLEDAFKQAFKVADVKHRVSQLANAKQKRDVVVYKMHGDVSDPANAILSKQQYEQYYRTHEAFITALSGDLTAKTFLFIGFSFTDPNLDYVLSRLHVHAGDRQHYCFMKKETKASSDDDEIFAYKRRKQKLKIDDLKRYRIKALLVDNYEDITLILHEIEFRFRKNTVFIAGSAEIYGDWDRVAAQTFIHTLSKELIRSDFRVVNGFGWGVGSAVINGALEAIYAHPEKYSEDQLIIRPFPQVATVQALPALWEAYRQRMISLAGIAIFLFGNKSDGQGNVVDANGVMREFQISQQHGLVPLPISATGYVAKHIYELISKDPTTYYPNTAWVVPLLEDLAVDTVTPEQLVEKLIPILKRLKR